MRAHQIVFGRKIPLVWIACVLAGVLSAGGRARAARLDDQPSQVAVPVGSAAATPLAPSLAIEPGPAVSPAASDDNPLLQTPSRSAPEEVSQINTLVLDEDTAADSHGVCIESGGGEVPTPHGHGLNTVRLELSSGETYVLIGEVVQPAGSQTPYFRVDLDEQPWLANANRVKSPSYAITPSGSSDFWKRFAGSRVKLKVRAIGRIRNPSSGEPVYEIGLDPVSGPCLVQPLK